MTSISQLLRRMRPNLYLYGDESGDFHSAPYFLLGVVLCRDPNRHELAIQRLRNKNRFRSELKYSSSDRNKAPFAKDAVDYFFGEPDLRFRALVIDNTQHDLDRFAGKQLRPGELAYSVWYKRVILSCTPERDGLIVYLDDRSRRKEDDLSGYLIREIPNLKNIQLVDSNQHELIQLADLLTGSVFGDATNTNHPLKRSIIDHIKGKIPATRLLSSDLNSNQKFSVDVWKPSKKAT